ncbi:hypothetical protein NDU88_010559 [Pleurodeles waltl]|uniref:Uncharacterized protein n=1 Tax=Pleurodeles waltl TaxID=8319 RepID=A0AAV7R0K1_PLEWA|nr:hypothetical protein NDU88_010559 [Pleurodeles waltl]
MTGQSATFSGADSPRIKTQRKQEFRRETAHLYTLHEERGHHGAGTPNPTCDSFPAPVPGAPMPAAKTTGCLIWRCPVQRHLTWRSFIAQLGWRSFSGQLGCGWGALLSSWAVAGRALLGSEDGAGGALLGSWAVAGGALLGSEDGAGGAFLGSWAVAGRALPGSEDGAGGGLLGSEDGAGGALLGSEDGSGGGLLCSEDGAGGGLLCNEDGAGGALLGSGDDGGLLRRAAPPRLAGFLVPLPPLGRNHS